ncbi:hypothetical protein ACLKA7_012078 [Drosophila subpalustris]
MVAPNLFIECHLKCLEKQTETEMEEKVEHLCVPPYAYLPVAVGNICRSLGDVAATSGVTNALVTCLVPRATFGMVVMLGSSANQPEPEQSRQPTRSSQLESRMIRMGHSLQIFFVAAAAASVFARFPTDAVQHLSAP